MFAHLFGKMEAVWVWHYVWNVSSFFQQPDDGKDVLVFCQVCLICDLWISLCLFSNCEPNIDSRINYISLIFTLRLLIWVLVWGQNVCKMNPDAILRKGLMFVGLACLLVKLDYISSMPVWFGFTLVWL